MASTTMTRSATARPRPRSQQIIRDFAAKKGIEQREIDDQEILERLLYPDGQRGRADPRGEDGAAGLRHRYRLAQRLRLAGLDRRPDVLGRHGRASPRWSRASRRNAPHMDQAHRLSALAQVDKAAEGREVQHVNAPVDTIETFRAETRAWLDANCPPEMRKPVRSEADVVLGRSRPAAQRRLEQPVARPHGGARLDRARLAARVRRRRPDARRDQGAARGDGQARLPQPAQLVRHLHARAPRCSSTAPRRRSRTTCPRSRAAKSAGARAIRSPTPVPTSPASQTSAEDAGDHFVVNGQKVWTSYADKADWIFCLVRTDKTVKQGGISFLLFDMASPGVSTKPILLISGYSPFCETFFDDVLVPKANLLGELNKGWDVAKYLLGHEREMISGMGLGTGGGASLGDRGRRRSAPSRTVGSTIRCCARGSRSFEVRAAAFRAMSERFIDELKAQALASRAALDDEVCRHRAQQAAPRADDGRRRLRRPRMGQRALERRRGAARRGCAPRPTPSRAAPRRCSSTSSPSAS